MLSTRVALMLVHSRLISWSLPEPIRNRCYDNENQVRHCGSKDDMFVRGLFCDDGLDLKFGYTISAAQRMTQESTHSL